MIRAANCSRMAIQYRRRGGGRDGVDGLFEPHTTQTLAPEPAAGSELMTPKIDWVSVATFSGLTLATTLIIPLSGRALETF